MTLENKTVFITGAARRVGRSIALAVAKQGANVILHYLNSVVDVEETELQIKALGRKCWKFRADLSNSKAVNSMMQEVLEITPLFALVNNASLFKPMNFQNSSLEDWNLHLQVNLTSPFLMTQLFASAYSFPETGRVINLLDWRALRPGVDHFPYTISKAGLAAFTKAAAVSLAPRILVNAVALGAILPPENEPENTKILESVPMKRWAKLDELDNAVLFLLDGPEYITGEIIHLDGGRHLV